MNSTFDVAIDVTIKTEINDVITPVKKEAVKSIAIFDPPNKIKNIPRIIENTIICLNSDSKKFRHSRLI